jgi:hypothetical protein
LTCVPRRRRKSSTGTCTARVGTTTNTIVVPADAGTQ